MVALILALALAQEPDLEVTFTTEPARIAVFLPELSKVYGRELLWDGVTKDEIITIRVKDVPATVLLEKIALEARAEWKAERAGLRLVRPPSLVNKELLERRALAEKQVRENLHVLTRKSTRSVPLTVEAAKKLVQDLQNPEFEYDPEKTYRDGEAKALAEKQRHIIGSMPIQRAAARLYGILDAKMLAALPSGRYVFSSRPTRMQGALPVGSTGILSELVREQNLLAMVAGPRTESDSEEDVAVFGSDLTPLPRDAKLVLRVTTDGDGDLSLSVAVRNSAGKTLLEESGYGFDASEVAVAADEKDSRPQGSAEEPLKVSERLRELIRTFNSAWPVEGAQGDFRRDLLAPERYDPMRLTGFSLLTSYAEQKNLNLVSAVPDFPWGGFELLPDNQGARIYPSEFRARVERLLDCKWKEEEGWIQLLPKGHRVLADRSFLANLSVTNSFRPADRSVVGRWARLIDVKKVISFDDVLRLMGPEELLEGYPDGWHYLYASLVEPEYSALLPRLPQDLGSFYASLSPAQRQAVWSEDGLDLSMLVGSQRMLLEKTIFQREEPWMGGSRGTNPLEQLYAEDPTEALPFGIVPGVVLKATITPSSRYFARSNSKETPPRLLDAVSIGRMLERREAGSARADFDTYMPVTHCAGEMKVLLNGQPLMSDRFSYNELIPNARRLKYEELPADVREAAEKELLRQRENRAKNPPKVEPPPPPAATVPVR